MRKKRTDPAIIRYALYLYFNSRSFRLAAKSLAPIRRRSHVSVWKWVQKYADCADTFRTDRRLVSAIFICRRDPCPDIDGHDDYWLWMDRIRAGTRYMLGHAPISREDDFRMLPVLQAAAK